MEKDDKKRVDKLFKRFKPLLDEKLKLKQRLRGLQSFLEIATPEDEAKLFQENDGLIFQVFHDALSHRITRIKVGILEMFVNKGNHYKIRNRGIKMLQFVLIRLEGMPNLAGPLEAHVNSPAVPDTPATQNVLITPTENNSDRSLATQLIPSEDPEPELRNLYSKVIVFELFKSIELKDTGFIHMIGTDEPAFPVSTAQWSNQKIIETEPKATAVPQLGPSVMIPREGLDTVTNTDLFADILASITELAQDIAKNASFNDYSIEDLMSVLSGEGSMLLKRMWTLFRDTFLVVLFPSISRALGLHVKNGFGFELCPIEFLGILLDFICKLTTYGKLSDQSPIKDLTYAILSNLLAKSSINFELVHEIVRQGFLNQQVSRPIYIISNWLTDSDHKPFLKVSSVTMRRIASIKSIESPTKTPTFKKIPDIKANVMIRRYIRYYRLSLEGKKRDPDMIAGLIKDILQFYRFLACEKIHSLDLASWHLLMDTLLDIQRILFLDPGNSVSMESAAGSEGLSFQLAETIFVTWIRSQIVTIEKWEELENNMSKMMSIGGVAQAWIGLMIPITYIMAESVYGISLLALKEDHTRHRKARAKHDRGSTNNLLQSTLDLVKKTDDNLERKPSFGKMSSKASSLVSEKTSLHDESGLDTVPGMQMQHDSLQFAQLKELKEILSPQPLLIWKNLICCIGKVHEITDTLTHSDVLNCIVTIWTIQERIRSLQSYTHVNMPSLAELSGIIFKAANMNTEYAKSSAIAASCVGRMMCKRHDQQLSMNWIPLYYQMILKHLSQPMNQVAYSLLGNSSKIYALGLQGATLTIPAMMKCLSSLVSCKSVPELAVRASISILGSLIAYEKQFRNLLTYPTRIDGDEEDSTIAYNPSENGDPLEVFVDLKYGILNILTTMLKFNAEKNNEDYCELIIWNLSVLCLEEGVDLVRAAEENLQNDIIYILLDHISSKQLPLVSAAADGLSLLCENYSRIKINDETLIHIIDRLAWGISTNLSIDENTKRKDLVSIVSISSLLFGCLLDWLMAIPSKMVSNPNIALRISEVIEEAIHVAAVGLDSLNEDTESEVEDRSSFFVTTNKQEYNEMVKIYEHLRESAENTLQHLMHHLENFSPCFGPEMMSSTLLDPYTNDHAEAEACQYFSLNESTLLCFIEKKEENRVRVLIRDGTGKYAWSMKAFHHSTDEVDSVHICERPVVVVTQKTFRESVKIAAISSDSEGLTTSKGSDPLESAILRIQHEHPECDYVIPEFDGFPETQFQQLIHEQIDEELNVAWSRIPPPPLKEPITPEKDKHFFEIARLFLAQTGQLSFDYLKEGKMAMLAKSVNLIRDIRGLDKKYSREVAKFAMIYVAPGQEDEGSIFRNSSGSMEYDEFVAALGWEVALADHPGYTGGLDSTMVIDGNARYYCTSTIEMIFHDLTKMPTDISDPKQLKKKRHIGNDHVHIIWNEHFRDYKWETIGGDFGTAQIAITPLPNGMYSIDTYRDELVRPFGPLQSRSVVTKECLGSLVRATAMNAYRNASSAGAPKGMETHPFTLRKQTISVISGRYKTLSDSYEKYMTAVFTDEK